VQGSVDPATGAIVLTEFLPAREGGESRGGRFEGRLDELGGMSGVWHNRSGRIRQNFKLQAGGILELGSNPTYRLLLEPIDGGTEGNHRGWLEWGGEAFDLGEGCVHQPASAMAGPEFENLQVEVLPGRPQIVHTAIAMTPVVGREMWLHKLYGPGSSHPLLQLEGGLRKSPEGDASSDYAFAYRGSDVIVTRLDDAFGPTGQGGKRGDGNRLAPACVEQRSEQVYRLQLAEADAGFLLMPREGFSEQDGIGAVSTILSPACEDDAEPGEELGPAVVIRNEQGLLSLQINPDPESGRFEAICWLAGRPRQGRAYFAVPPPEAVKSGLTAALPLTVRWPAPGQPRAVAVFLDPGDNGPEPAAPELLAFYDRATHSCHNRLLSEPGEWGGPIDETLFRKDFPTSPH
jgi:hypothetical protein